MWHLAIWPEHRFGDERPVARDESADDGARAARSRPADAKLLNDASLDLHFAKYDRDAEIFFKEISRFAVAVQRLGRVAEPEELEFTSPTDLELDPSGATRRLHGFKVCEPQALAFTLWWSDEAGRPDADGKARLNAKPVRPAHSDLRVRASIQTHRDHATVTFFIDVAKPYNADQIRVAAEVTGDAGQVRTRRSRILDLLTHVRQVAGEQVRSCAVDQPHWPETAVSKQDAEKLLDAADYLYEGVWREFMASFDITFEPEPAPSDPKEPAQPSAGPYGRRFADFRGLVMSMRGLETPADKKRRDATKTLRELNNIRASSAEDALPSKLGLDTPDPHTSSVGVGALDLFDEESNEGNTVLKSLWPFLRRVSPWADHRDFVGCGVMNWRALYVTALGSGSRRYSVNEEYESRDREIPSGHTPAIEKFLDVNQLRQSDLPVARTWRDNRPLRYLMVTKGEPHRNQMGRFVERINALGTMRLFALRNIASIKNASVHIELLGRLLDGLLKDWSEQRATIEADYASAVAKLPRRRNRSLGTQFEIPDKAKQTVAEQRIRALSESIRIAENNLITITAWLDNIGEGGSGRMLYVINRAKAYISDFERMHPSLIVGEIPGWVTYSQFVNRSLRPLFDFIGQTGERLESVRRRLQTVTETIQTAALIVEAEATRDNTALLRRISSNTLWRQTSMTALVFAAVMLGLDVADKLKITQWLSDAIIRAFERSPG